MNLLKNILFFAIVATFLWSCQPDDLCEKKVNTPRLVVRFYDTNNTKSVKLVNNLIVYGKDHNTILINATTDSIALPLKLNAPTTFVMVSNASYDGNSGTINGGKTATITLSYNTENQFVNKACGFRAIYNSLSYVVESSSETWIKSVSVKNTEIKDEKNAKIHIYH